MKIDFFKKPVFIIILAIFVVIVSTVAILWIINNHNHPDPKVYFSTHFGDGIDMYEYLDATWQQQSDHSNRGIVTLSSKKYAAPYLMIPLTLEENPPNSFVFHIRTYIESYTNEAVNLGTLIYPTGSISIITNQDDRVGISNTLFAEPTYNDSGVLKRESWNDIYAYIDTKESEISIYVNNKLALISEFEDTVYPIQEIWLGAIWLNGGGQYGAPKDIQFSNVELGNKGILPKPTIIEFIRNTIFKLL